MTSSSYNNGVSESRTYNSDNTLASISYTEAAIGNLSYGWDANKNKTSETIGGTMSGYGFAVGSSGYDDEDRLVNWQRSDTNLNQSWDLSLVGDWDTFTENASAQSRTHGPTHELLTAAGQSVTHDAKGNMTLIPAVLRPGSDPLKMKWDFENKLRAADTDNDNIDDVFYRFDALGRRVGRDDGTANVVYFQDGQQTVADYPVGTAAGSPTYTYVYASYIDEPVMRGGSGGLRYYHRNQQYSITALTDGGGTIAERYAYTAYGQVTFANASGTVQTASASNNRYTYTGREWDQGLSLYHYRARMYDAVAGRFVSRDPIGYKGSEWSLFEYCEGSPFIYNDPTGLQSTVLRPDVLIAAGLTAQEIAQATGMTVTAAAAIAAYKAEQVVEKLIENYKRNAKGRNPCEKAKSALTQAERSIRTRERRIQEHEGYIRDPSTYPGVVRNVESARAVWRREIGNWREEIRRAQTAIVALKKAADLACRCFSPFDLWPF